MATTTVQALIAAAEQAERYILDEGGRPRGEVIAAIRLAIADLSPDHPRVWGYQCRWCAKSLKSAEPNPTRSPHCSQECRRQQFDSHALAQQRAYRLLDGDMTTADKAGIIAACIRLKYGDNPPRLEADVTGYHQKLFYGVGLTQDESLSLFLAVCAELDRRKVPADDSNEHHL
ncbi:hypothetical protein [Limnoglobus roseus]|uniref:Uncharacterized protein n=1 Tax=Limnoglobus roseus TaxID=2598579 RepID=A0A5C1AFW8_9BACT|nr:hypothetical protein [Limnoglobus roseus]QEL18329.1 hypothetical protein PX52LOC_05350 [Limnoglobus roseus]